MLTGESLAAFIAVAETGSFSRAAERLNVAQSVISKRLHRLEDQLATRLVDRDVRTAVRLTRVGELFLDEAHETLARLDRAERAGVNLGRGSSGPLRIGYVFSAAMNGIVATMLRVLRRELPELRFDLHMMETPEQIAAIEAGRLDIGLIRPRPSYPAGCAARVVHTEPLVVCLQADHPVADHEALCPAQLAGQRFIVPQFHEQVGLIDHIRRLAKAGGFAMPEIVRTEDFVTAACLAAAGDGIVLAPMSLTNLGLAGLVFRPLAQFSERVACVLLHRHDAPAEALHWLRQTNGVP